MDDIEPVDVTVASDGDTGRDVTVRLRDATATVGELAVALGWPAGPLAVDGVEVVAAAPLVTSGLRRGSVVRVPGRRPRPPQRMAAVLRWTGGVDAGRSVALAPGTTVIGRARDAHLRCRDPRVAPYACLVHVGADGRRVEPLVAAPVTLAAPALGSRWRIGARHAELAGPDDHRVARRAEPARPGRWTVPFHRPPRPPLPAAPPPVPAPRLTAVTARTALGGTGAVAALIAAVGSVAAALVLSQPAFLLLGGLGAAGSLVSWIVQHRAGRRAARAGRRRDRIALASFAAAVAAQAEAIATARWGRALELPTAVTRAGAGDARLWERRPHHDDFLELVLGVGTVPWVPEVDGHADEPTAAIVTALAPHDGLTDVPVTVALRPGTVLGLVGDVDAARALARSLVVQLAVGSGPADLAIVVDATIAGWEWTRWLPHIEDAAARVVVVDGTPADLVDTAAIVVAPDVLALPSCCTHVVSVGADADVSLLDLATGVEVNGVVGAGASVATATAVARSLARYEDPERRRPGGDLPLAVDLGGLLGPGALDGETVAAAWAALPADPPLRAPIGLDGDGPVEIDLIDDGPHALVAGTTGSGKSELLRSLVAGLAARCSPEHLAFVLVDYKGGSAFDVCATLPHVTAVVTDLDGRLAARALRSLEAELRRRERRLRAAGAPDLVAFRHAGGHLPRLVIVVDEMAGLAAELPDFVPALVGVAQRGRSLGLHLVLATQRPAGVVTDDIRANTNLRIALRVQTAAESHDVLGRADAAELPRDRPGRAVLRRGPDDVTVVQVAHTGGEVAPAGRPAVEVIPVGGGRAAGDRPPTGRAAGDRSSTSGRTTLARLVDALGDAARRRTLTPVAPPWFPPLPNVLALDDLPPGAVALADDPDHQAQHPVSWTHGNLLCVGVAGSGTTTALVSLAVALAGAVPPAERHLYVVDMGAGGLAPLASLPHAVVVTAADRERQARLVRRLHAEVEHRRAGAAGTGPPEIVLLVDGLAALRAAFDDPVGFALLDTLDQVITGGAAVGVRVAATVDRAGALPVAVLAGFGRRWTFRAVDGPPLPPGRAVDGDSGLEVQIATPSGPLSDVGAEVARRWSPSGGPGRIGVLPADVPALALPPPRVGSDRWMVPVGIADADLQPAALVLHPGDHVFIGGRSRTGRSSALVLLAQRLRAGAPPDLLVAALALRPSPLREAGAELVVSDPAGLPALAVLGDARRPAVLLVDDAERVDDDGTLVGLVAAAGSRIHVVAAGRPDVLRSLYGHWTAPLRRSRLGVLLQPDVDVDGDLLGTVLPRRPAVARLARVPGRGYLVVDGRSELVQLAAPANMGA